jgi:hypothetical protein
MEDDVALEETFSTDMIKPVITTAMSATFYNMIIILQGQNNSQYKKVENERRRLALCCFWLS